MVIGDPVGRAALKKASWRLLPLLFLGYGIAYVDRVNISFAALQMNQELHFSNTVYGFGGGVLFLSYAVCEIPSNLLLLRFGARRWIARIMLTWLTQAEREWISSHLSAEVVTAGRPEEKNPALARALLDPRVWLIGICNLCIFTASYAFGLSAPTVLKSVPHWNAAHVGLLMSITALLGAGSMLFNGAHSDRYGERHLHTVIPLSLAVVAFLAMGLSMTPWVVVPAYILYYTCYTAVHAAFWLIPSDSLRGRSAAVALAAIGSIGMLGAFIGPFAWGLARDYTGTYQVGLLSLAVPFGCAAILLLFIRRTTRSAHTTASSRSLPRPARTSPPTP